MYRRRENKKGHKSVTTIAWTHKLDVHLGYTEGRILNFIKFIEYAHERQILQLFQEVFYQIKQSFHTFLKVKFLSIKIIQKSWKYVPIIVSFIKVPTTIFLHW
jgi:hypothetical protein